MIRALRTASTGMQAQQRQVETIANNIANVNTTGFKRNRLAFRSLLYQTYRRPGANVTQNEIDPTGLQVGTGTEVSSSVKSFLQGDLMLTDNELDVAINGSGFFSVDMPSGDQFYTRDGSFRKDADGNLVTADGYRLSDAITIPQDALSVSIGVDGTVMVQTPGNLQGTSVGKIQLHRFANPAGLDAKGDNLFAETPSSGTPSPAEPGLNGAGLIKQGFLERSNVQVVNELIELIQAQRNYELNSRTIRVGDEMMQQVNQMAR